MEDHCYRLTRRRASRLSFCRDESGAITVIFALLLLPMLMCVGMAIDYGRLQSAHGHLQYAADMAAVAAADQIMAPDRIIQNTLETVVKVNTNKIDGEVMIDLWELRNEKQSLYVRLSVHVPMLFGALFLPQTRMVQADAEVTRSRRLVR